MRIEIENELKNGQYKIALSITNDIAEGKCRKKGMDKKAKDLIMKKGEKDELRDGMRKRREEMERELLREIREVGKRERSKQKRNIGMEW